MVTTDVTARPWQRQATHNSSMKSRTSRVVPGAGSGLLQVQRRHTCMIYIKMTAQPKSCS